jgi:hypothetical protein
MFDWNQVHKVGRGLGVAGLCDEKPLTGSPERSGASVPGALMPSTKIPDNIKRVLTETFTARRGRPTGLV